MTESVNKMLLRLSAIQKQELGYIVLFDTDGLQRNPFSLTSYWNHLFAYKEDTIELQPIYDVKNWTRIGSYNFRCIETPENLELKYYNYIRIEIPLKLQNFS